MGKPRSDSGNGSRTIIARFLRYSFEDIQELHELRKKQMDKLKKARKDGKRAHFRKSEPENLFIDGKYVQC